MGEGIKLDTLYEVASKIVKIHSHLSVSEKGGLRIFISYQQTLDEFSSKLTLIKAGAG